MYGASRGTGNIEKAMLKYMIVQPLSFTLETGTK